MKICYLADAVSIHAQRWVNYFARKGHKVHLITQRLGEGYLEGVQLCLLPSPLTSSCPGSGYINAVVWIIQTRRLISRIKPDIIDAHFITTHSYLAIASGFHPVVLTAWGSDILIDPKQRRLYRFLTRYALGKAEAVICDSEMMRKELAKLGVSLAKIRIIYNGIDTNKFKPQPGKDRLGLQGAPVIISTRKLAPVYNVEMLIKAIPLILEHSPQAHFLVIGDGVQREYLESLTTSSGISENVSFLGWIPHDELPDYLASADIYVSTSLSDSTSLSLQEAMACELPPVVTDLLANREWVKDGENGFIVPQNDPQALAEKVNYLIENREVGERFGKEGRKIVKERAEYEKEMEKVEKLYEGMVRTRKSSRKELRA